MALPNATIRLRLTAGLSDTLWHITTSSAAAKILRDDRFALKPSDGTEAESAFGNAYYLSTARSTLSNYIKSTAGSASVMFMLDGRKLAERYKGAPVDYWGSISDHDEMEDRVFSSKPFIPALPYIVSVHAVADGRPALYTVWRECRMHKLPLYFYRDPRDLSHPVPSKRIDFRPEYGEMPKRTARDPNYQRKHSSMRAWVNLWDIPIPDGTSPYKMAKKAGDQVYFVYGILRYQDDGYRQLAVEMHNAKGSGHGDSGGDREALDRLIGIMRSNKLDVKGYVDALRRKWYPAK